MNRHKYTLSPCYLGETAGTARGRNRRCRGSAAGPVRELGAEVLQRLAGRGAVARHRAEQGERIGPAPQVGIHAVEEPARGRKRGVQAGARGGAGGRRDGAWVATEAQAVGTGLP